MRKNNRQILTVITAVVALVGLTSAATTNSPAGSGSAPQISKHRPAPPIPPPAQIAFGDPLQGLSTDELAQFEEGKEEFGEAEESDEGLGPVFNAESCSTCHLSPEIGGGSTLVETRFGTTDGGKFDPLSALGGSLIQSQGVGTMGLCEYVGEVVPPEATITAGRRTTPLFGLGLVDAVPDQVFFEIARRQLFRRDGVFGHPNIVLKIATGQKAVGKFGWKSQVPTLFQFSGDAYLNEMGITSAQFMQENCPQGDCSALSCDPVVEPEDDGTAIDKFHHFMTFLGPPPRGPITTEVFAGEQVFNQIGCETCHVSTLRTGPNPIPALDRVTFHPYSDFLLHNMGSLGDGIAQALATGRDMRTAPLWGLRAMTMFLHDGRALSLDSAVLAHDGEARAARQRYAQLDAARTLQLLAFLKSL